MRIILSLALLLLAIPAYAGPEMLLAVMQSDGRQAFTINGYNSISSAGVTDSGTESISTGVGKITINASCEDDGSGVSVVSLEVDGSIRALLSCPGDGSTKNAVLSYIVTAGNHNVRVYGNADPGESFSANNFRKP